ncbi:MAG: hypothetical protein OXF19_02510, partial [Hyphomicrobiales bacterium]|nr:hypothetical protein [Hyphomicrobiales bacterium]
MNLFHSATVVVSAVTKSPPPPPPNLIRGGRLRKTSKGLISFAPFLAGASALALGALLSTTSPVEAGSCSTANQPAGTARCANPVNSTDQTVMLTAPANGSFTVTDAPNFGLDLQTANTKGIVIDTVTTTTDVSVDFDHGNVKATGNAIEIDQDGTGATTFEMDGTITSTGGKGFTANVANTATGAVQITTGGAVTAELEGIELVANGTGPVTVTANGNITSSAQDGIEVLTGGTSTGDTKVYANGNITAGIYGIHVTTQRGAMVVETAAGTNVRSTSTSTSNGYAINANNAFSVAAQNGRGQDITVTTHGDLGTSSSRTRGGIWAVQRGFGDMRITVNGDVFSTADSNGIRAGLALIGFVDITTNGNIYGGTDAGRFGIRLWATTSGNSVTANDVLRVTTTGKVEGHTAISVSGAHGHHDSTISIGGDVTGTGGTALHLHGVADHDVTVQSGATVTGRITNARRDSATNLPDSSAGFDGGLVGLDINGTVTVTSGDAIELGGAGAHTITVGTGGNVGGTIDLSAATGAMDININGGTVAVASGDAIQLGGAGAHTITVGTGGTVTGTIDASAVTGGTTLDISG